MRIHTFSALALAALCSTATAADHVHTGRLVLDVKIDGTGHTQSGRATATVSTAETLHLAFTLASNGMPVATNRLDPASLAAAIPTPSSGAPSQEQQKQIMEQAQKAAQACGRDIACMQKIALDLGKQTAAWQTAAPASHMEERYLDYAPGEPQLCKPEFRTRVADSTAGTRNDVQGLVPFAQKYNADYSGNANDFAILCTSNVTVDVKTNRIYVAAALPETRGRVLFTEGARTTSDSPAGTVNLNQQAMAWVMNQLKNAQRAGMQKTTLRYPISGAGGHRGEDVVNVEMRWSFDGK